MSNLFLDILSKSSKAGVKWNALYIQMVSVSSNGGGQEVMTSWIGYILFSGTTMDRFGHGHLVFWTILPKKLVTSLKYVVKHKSVKLSYCML